MIISTLITFPFIKILTSRQSSDLIYQLPSWSLSYLHLYTGVNQVKSMESHLCKTGCIFLHCTLQHHNIIILILIGKNSLIQISLHLFLPQSRKLGSVSSPYKWNKGEEKESSLVLKFIQLSLNKSQNHLTSSYSCRLYEYPSVLDNDICQRLSVHGRLPRGVIPGSIQAAFICWYSVHGSCMMWLVLHVEA